MVMRRSRDQVWFLTVSDIDVTATAMSRRPCHPELVEGCATIVAAVSRPGTISATVAEGAPVGGIAIVAAVLSVTSFWYGGVAFMTCFMWARYGVVHVPALVIGAAELWAGGLFGLAAGTLVRTPPALPERPLIIGWTVVIFAGVLAVMVMRRPEVEELLPERARRMTDGRYIALGALAAAAVLFVAGYF